MDSRKRRTTMVFSSTFWIALVFGLCVAPNVQVQGADYEWYSGGTHNVEKGFYSIYVDGDGTIVNVNVTIESTIFVCFLSPGATLNFGAGASAVHIDAGTGSSVNLNGGSVGWVVSVSPGAKVTVAGSRFDVGGTQYGPGTTVSPQSSVMVTAYDASNIPLFRGSILCFPGATITLGAEATDLEVEIDVKPDSDPAIINLRSNGMVPVAVLSDETFDATQVLPGSVQFAGAKVAVSRSGKYMAHAEDVDKDGDDDMLFHFRTQELKLENGAAKATVKLTGQLGGSQTESGSIGSLKASSQIDDGMPISGDAEVYVLQPKKKK